MCRSKADGGRVCPAFSKPERVAERNARRRLNYAQSKHKTLTDTLYSRHLEYSYQTIAKLVALGKETHNTYGMKTETGDIKWDINRAKKHKEIIEEVLASWSDVPRERQAVMSGGLGGAGKSTVLNGYAGIDTKKFATLNPDDIKEIMAEKGLIPTPDGLTPMDASPLVHEEASHITSLLAKDIINKGYNVIYDITMGSYPSATKKLQQLKDAGYEVEGVFVDISPETSLSRSQFRHREGLNDYLVHNKGYGGRLLPKEIVSAQVPDNPENKSKNIEVFFQVQQEGWFKNSSIYDNNRNGEAPMKIG